MNSIIKFLLRFVDERTACCKIEKVNMDKKEFTYSWLWYKRTEKRTERELKKLFISYVFVIKYKILFGKVYVIKSNI